MVTVAKTRKANRDSRCTILPTHPTSYFVRNPTDRNKYPWLYEITCSLTNINKTLGKYFCLEINVNNSGYIRKYQIGDTKRNG